MSRWIAATGLGAATLALSWPGCGAAARRGAGDLPPDAVPLRAGTGTRYRPPPRSAAAARGRPVRGMRCASHGGPRFAAHVELIVERRVVLIPAGVGVATARACSYPLRTREPTGLVEVSSGARRTLGDFFALWGQPLGPRRVGGFRARAGGRVRAFLDGKPRAGSPADLPLRRHAVVVLELGPFVVPHSRYVFPPGY